jgi:dUTP pyrophosphatase
MALSDCLQVRLLSPEAVVPKRGSEGAAGYDIYSIEDGIVPAHGKSIVSTGLAITVPSGTYGRIAPRSGLAAKHGISVGAGVIDRDFTGHVKVILFNHSDVDYGFSKGDRIAQLIVERISIPPVAVVNDLIVTERGEQGFGSTGM